jgi:hypothetical protein
MTATTVFGDPFEIAGQHPDCLENLGAFAGVQHAFIRNDQMSHVFKLVYLKKIAEVSGTRAGIAQDAEGGNYRSTTVFMRHHLINGLLDPLALRFVNDESDSDFIRRLRPAAIVGQM